MSPSTPPLSISGRPQRRRPPSGSAGAVAAAKKLTTFVENVLAQQECLGRGDAGRGNRHAKRYVRAAQELLAGGEASIDAFATLMSEANDDPVRSMAAAFLLSARTELAVATLRPISEGTGLAALGAQMALERYERGELEIR